MSTGYLNILRNVIIQKNYENLKVNQRNKHESRKQATINNILSAYHEARERLEAIIDPGESEKFSEK